MEELYLQIKRKRYNYTMKCKKRIKCDMEIKHIDCEEIKLCIENNDMT